MIASHGRDRSMPWLPLFSSVITRAAIAFISGPAEKRILALSPNFLLNAASSRFSVFCPPKVCAPAINVISDSFLAPAIKSPTSPPP